MSQQIYNLSKKGEKFIKYSNTDGKSWIMPIRNMRTALNLYQPSSFRGKLIKLLLPYIYWIPFLHKVIHSEFLNIELNNSLNQILKNVLNNKDFQFSFFFGTPAVYQKPTIQISKHRKILAYCKVSDNVEIINLFKKEKDLLNYIGKKGVKNIPKPLYCDKIDNNNYLFIQSTFKTNNSRLEHKWTSRHWSFLTQLYESTKATYYFDCTDFAKSLCVLEEYLSDLPVNESKIVSEAINKVRKHYGSGEVEFSLYHGDFTPWNMFLAKENLYTFDFEYAKMSCPPYLDFFHFTTQVLIIKDDYSYNKIYDYCHDSARKHDVFNSNFSITYLSYLLNVVSFYFEINNKVLNMNDRCYRKWLPLMNLIVTEK